jgi:hypothetical protein
MTDLVGADPFPLDRPGAEALVVRVVAGEVTVLDQAAAGVPAGEVDDFELFVVEVSVKLSLIFSHTSVERKRRQMGRKAKSETERRKNQSKRGAYLTHGCGFADGKIFDFRSTEGFSSSRLEYSPISSGNSSCSGSFYGGVRCARSSVSFRSERRTAARATGQGRRLTSKGLATCFPLCVLGVAVRRLSHWLGWRIERSKIHLWKTAGCKDDDA